MVEEEKDIVDGEEEEQDPEKNEDDLYPNTDAKMRDDARNHFQTMDKENQGFIDMASLGNLLRWLDFNPTETEMEEYRSIYD